MIQVTLVLQNPVLSLWWSMSVLVYVMFKENEVFMVIFLKVDLLGLYLLQRTVIVYTYTIKNKLSNSVIVLMFPFEDVSHYTSVKGDVEACIILNYLFSRTRTGTCTHLMKS